MRKKIARSEYFAKLYEQAGISEWQEECEQLAAWLRELAERRKQPEIIRCKDCKEFRRWINTDIEFCDRTENRVSENDFCSMAERKTDG